MSKFKHKTQTHRESCSKKVLMQKKHIIMRLPYVLIKANYSPRQWFTCVTCLARVALMTVTCKIAWFCRYFVTCSVVAESRYITLVNPYFTKKNDINLQLCLLKKTTLLRIFTKERMVKKNNVFSGRGGGAHIMPRLLISENVIFKLRWCIK